MQPSKTPFLAVRDLAQRLDGNASDYDALLEMVRGRDLVLLGEATHGTAEFYRMRAEITLRLIGECGFDTVAIEGDWPDAWRINRYVQGEGPDDATTALDDFERFPAWMWRNREMCDFIAALRALNAAKPRQQRTGVYGLDLYSLYRSADAVIRYLGTVDPHEVALARERYAALDHVRDPQTYGYTAALGARPAARAGAVQQLLQLRADEFEYLSRDGTDALDAQFFAEQNAQVVVNAEAYYRGMFSSRINTWNLRDSHMANTLFALARYRVRRGGSGKSYADVGISFGSKAPFQSGPDIVDGGKVGSPFRAGRQAGPFGPGLLKPFSIISGMAYGQIGGLRVVNIAFEDVGARRVEEPVAHHRSEGTRCRDRLGDETIYGGDNARSVESSTGDDFQRRIEGEMANECSEPAKHHTLQFCQEPKAPIQRGLQCLLPRWRGSRP